MEASDILALHHRRVVDEFIESVRRELETELVPGLTAIQAVFHAADAQKLGKELPEWLDRVSSVMPAESAFMTEMGRYLDPAGYDLQAEILGLMPGQSEARRSFDAHLWEMAPCVSRGAGS